MRTIKFRIWSGRKMVFGPTDDNPNSSWVLAFAGTINYPLQQFTGLLDKNGKEIYEGDILRFGFKNQSVGVVRFGKYNNELNDDSGNGWYISTDLDSETNNTLGTGLYTLFSSQEKEIIGNNFTKQ